MTAKVSSEDDVFDRSDMQEVAMLGLRIRDTQSGTVIPAATLVPAVEKEYTFRLALDTDLYLAVEQPGEFRTGNVWDFDERAAHDLDFAGKGSFKWDSDYGELRMTMHQDG